MILVLTVTKSGKMPLNDVDQGWAWIVLAGTCVWNGLVPGLLRSMGVVYLGYLELFDQGPVATGWIGSSFSLSMAVSAPIGGYIADQITSTGRLRVVVMSTCAVSGLFMMSAAWAPSLSVTIVLFTLAGLTVGSMAGCVLSLLVKFFDKRRFIASGVSFAAGNIGALALSPMFAALIGEYGIRGCMLVFAGLWMNLVVVGATIKPALRPIVAMTMEANLEVARRKNIHLQNTSLITSITNSSSRSSSQPLESEARKSVWSANTAAHAHVTTGGTPAGGEPVATKAWTVDGLSTGHSNPAFDDTSEASRETPPQLDADRSPKDNTITNSRTVGYNNNGHESDTVEHSSSDAEKQGESGNRLETVSENVMADDHVPSRYTLNDASTLPKHTAIFAAELDSDIIQSRQTASGDGSNSSPQSARPASGVGLTVLRTAEGIGPQGTARTNGACLKIVHDYWSLLTTPGFFSLVCTFICSCFAYFNQFFLLPLIAHEIGLGRHVAALLVSVPNVSELASKIIAGVLIDKGVVSSTTLLAVTFAVTLCLGICVSFTSSTWLLFGYAVLFGLFGGLSESLMIPMMAKLVPADKAATVSSMLPIIVCISTFSGPPIITSVQEGTGTYYHSLRLVVSFYAVALALMFLRHSKRMCRQEGNAKPKEMETICTHL